MGKFNLLTTLSLNAAGMTEGLQKSIKDVEEYVEKTKASNTGLNLSFRDVAEMGLGEMRRELMKLKNISFAGKTTEEIAIIKNRMGDLTDTMKYLKAEVSVLGGETMGAVVGGFQAIAATVQGLGGALAILGVDSKVVQSLEKNMVNLIGVSQALATVEDMISSGKLRAIALKIKDSVVTGYQKVATMAATAAQWLYNAALGTTVAIIGGAVIVVAALAAGIYYLARALNDSDEEMKENVASIRSYSSAHKELFTTIKDNQAKISDLEKQYAVSTGKMTKEQYDIWKATQDKKAEQDENFKKRAIALETAFNAFLIASKDKTGEELQALEAAYNSKRGQIISDFGKNSEIITQKYDLQINNIKKQYQNSRLQDLKNHNKQMEDEWVKAQEKNAYLSQFNAPQFSQATSQGPVERQDNRQLVKQLADQKKLDKGILASMKDRHDNVMSMISIEKSAATKAAEDLLKLEKEKNMQKVDAMSKTFGIAASLFKENTIAYKAMAIAQASMDTYKAANMALASAPPPFNFILMAATIAAGIANVGKIAGAFAAGGIIPGNSYAGDQMLARVNSAEMILNQGQQSALWEFVKNGASGQGQGGNVRFVIEGTQLVGVMDNHSRKVNNSR